MSNLKNKMDLKNVFSLTWHYKQTCSSSGRILNEPVSNGSVAEHNIFDSRLNSLLLVLMRQYVPNLLLDYTSTDIPSSWEAQSVISIVCFEK